ncbi:hypothetical protein [Roseibium sp. M-1]
MNTGAFVASPDLAVLLLRLSPLIEYKKAAQMDGLFVFVFGLRI